MTLSKKLLLALTSCFIFLVTLEVGLNLLAPFYRSLQTRSSTAGKYTVVVLGESTSTDLVTEGGRSWATQLEERLKGSGFNNVEIVNLSEPGLTTTSLVKKLSDYLRIFKPQMVISMMGINDTPHFWYNELSPIQSEDRPFQFKTLKLLKVLFYNPEVQEQQYQVPKKPQPSKLDHPAYDNLVQNFMRYQISSAGYKKTLQEVETFLSGKTKTEKAQFYARLTEDLKPIDEKPVENFLKSYGMIKLSVQNDATVSKSLDVALTLARVVHRKEDCRVLVQQALDQNAEISTISTGRLMFCNPEDREFIAALLEKQKSPFKLEESRRMPTVANYKAVFDLLMNRDICWIAMGYPVEILEEGAMQFKGSSKNGKFFFLLENKSAFEEVLKTEKYNTLFTDSFAGKFGHFTARSAKLIAENAFNKIQSLKSARLCGL